MTRIAYIFMDFDGVTHPWGEVEDFRCLGYIEAVVREFPEARIVIANESVPFCRTCSRLRLSSTGWLHGCLSSSNRHYVGDLLDKPRHQALPALQRLLVRALADKQEVAFAGGVTVMKIIGG